LQTPGTWQVSLAASQRWLGVPKRGAAVDTRRDRLAGAGADLGARNCLLKHEINALSYRKRMILQTTFDRIVSDECA
jgi:hypothetical protein